MKREILWLNKSLAIKSLKLVNLIKAILVKYKAKMFFEIYKEKKRGSSIMDSKKLIYKRAKNSIWNLEINKNMFVMEKKELSIEKLMDLYFEGADIIYVTQAGAFLGIITSSEIIQSLRKRKVEYNSTGKCVYAGLDEYERAMDIFSKYAVIHNIPVIDNNGYLLYEYKKAYRDANVVQAYYNNLEVDYGLNLEEERNPKIIVSLTSYGKRLKSVYLTVLSLMTQTLKADKIVLYVAKDSVQFIDNKLRRLQDKGLTIVEGVENIRVHKKYYYAMQEYSNDLLITVDDDVMYDDVFIESLYASYCQYPDAVSYRRVHRMIQKDKVILPYNEWDSNAKSVIEPSFALFGTSVGGEIYPPHCMDERILDIELCKKLAYYQDDLWMKYMQLLAGTKVKYVEGKCANVLTIPNSQTLNCNTLNCQGGWNDVYIEKLSEYFKINLADYC